MAEAPRTPKRIVDVNRLAMFANHSNNTRRAKLVWSIRDGNPRISVYTNEEDRSSTERQYPISAPMDPVTFYSFLTLLEKVVQRPEENKFKLDCFTTEYVNDKPTDNKRLMSVVWFGKDNAGKVWISVVTPDKPQIRFNFELSSWHGIYKQDGQALTESEASCLVAASYVVLLRQVMAEFLSHTVIDPSWAEGTPRATGPTSTSSKPSNQEFSFDDDVSF